MHNKIEFQPLTNRLRGHLWLKGHGLCVSASSDSLVAYYDVDRASEAREMAQQLIAAAAEMVEWAQEREKAVKA
jgi:hypothetical protein